MEKAIIQLVEEEVLARILYNSQLTTLRFIVPARVTANPQKKRALSAHMRAKARIVDKYSKKDVLDDLGKHLEALVKQELRANGLTIVAEHKQTRTYKGKTWTETGHDLDYIAEHPSGEAFGVEVKNELPSIDDDEFYPKITMCRHLGLRPVFICRYMVWSYVPKVRDAGGFVITIGNQMYPLGYKHLVEEIRDKMSLPDSKIPARLQAIAPKLRHQWPIEVRTDLPPDVCQRISDRIRIALTGSIS